MVASLPSKAKTRTAASTANSEKVGYSNTVYSCRETGTDTSF
jgi:hypothetical protein